MHDIWLTIILSCFITFLVIGTYHLLQTKKEKKGKEIVQNSENALAISSKFLLLTKQEVLKEFDKYLNKKYETRIKSDYIMINKNIIQPIFTKTIITDADVIESYTKTKKISAEKLIIVCKSASDSALQIANIITDKKVVVLEEMEAYLDIYKPLMFDVPKTEKKRRKRNAYYYFSFAFSKKRTKNYFLVSIFLLLSSFVLRYNLYYIVFASITTLLALYSHFNKKFNETKNMSL